MKNLRMIGLSLVLTVALAITAFASGSISFAMTPESAELSPGDTLTLTASCSGSAEATSYGLMLKFDEDIFEMVSGDVTVEDALVKSFGAGTAHGFVFMFEEPKSYSDKVGTAVLKVKASAPEGTYTITGTSSVKNGGDTVESAGCSVTVTVSGSSIGEESTAASVPEDIGEIIGSATLPVISKPADDTPTESEIKTEASVESEPMTGTAVESVPTTGTEIVPEEKAFPSWIFLVAAGVVAAVGIVALVIIKKKK